jgi:hypothetical protein
MVRVKGTENPITALICPNLRLSPRDVSTADLEPSLTGMRACWSTFASLTVDGPEKDSGARPGGRTAIAFLTWWVLDVQTQELLRRFSRGEVAPSVSRSPIQTWISHMSAARSSVLHPEHGAPLLSRVIGHAHRDRVTSTFSLLADPTRARIRNWVKPA